MPMGNIVRKQRTAFIWIPALTPFHVTNLSKLKIAFPQRCRKYAKHVEDSIPILEEEITIANYEDFSTAHALVRILPDVPDDDFVEEDILDVPIADPEGVQEADLTLPHRKMSKRALLQEVQSEAHRNSLSAASFVRYLCGSKPAPDAIRKDWRAQG